METELCSTMLQHASTTHFWTERVPCSSKVYNYSMCFPWLNNSNPYIKQEPTCKLKNAVSKATGLYRNAWRIKKWPACPSEHWRATACQDLLEKFQRWGTTTEKALSNVAVSNLTALACWWIYSRSWCLSISVLMPLLSISALFISACYLQDFC